MEEDYNDHNEKHVIKRWKQYINTIDNVNPLVLKALSLVEEKKISVHKVLDFGCGSGFDSNLFVSKGFDVLAIDYNPDCQNRINELFPILSSNPNFKFETHRAENFTWQNFDLISSIKVLPFLEEEIFYNTLENIRNNLPKGGIFVGNFFGPEDDWQDKTLVSGETIKDIFKDFEFLYFKDEVLNTTTVAGEKKKAHLIEIIVQK